MRDGPVQQPPAVTVPQVGGGVQIASLGRAAYPGGWKGRRPEN